MKPMTKKTFERTYKKLGPVASEQLVYNDKMNRVAVIVPPKKSQKQKFY